MNNTYITLFLILVTCCFSCKPTYNEISQLELDEWQVYSQNDLLIFIDNFGQRDTHKVVTVFGGYSNNNDVYNERVIANIIKLNDQVPINNTGFLRLEKDGSDLDVFIRWPHHNTILELTSTPSIPFYIYNGDTLYNVYISTVPSILIDSTHSYIDSVFYAKSLGFFRYTDIYKNNYTKIN